MPRLKAPVSLMVLDYIESRPSGFTFSIKELMDTLGLPSTVRASVHRIINDALDEHLIEKLSFGWYQITKEPRVLSIDEMQGKKLKIPLPFNLGFKFDLYPGAIVLFIALPGKGKSYFAVNLCKFWAERGFALDYYFCEAKESIVDRLLRMTSEGFWVDKDVRFIEIENPSMRMRDDSKNRIVIWDWLDLTAQYHKVPLIMRRMQKDHKSLIVIFMQGRPGEEGILPFGKLGGLHPVSVAFAITHDEKDKRKEYPILKVKKVRDSSWFCEGDEIYLKFDSSTGEIKPLDIRSRDELRKLITGEITEEDLYGAPDQDEIPF